MTANTRVVVAMSGGVDSSVSAVLLKTQGFDVVGLMMRIWGEPVGPGSSYNRCCSPDSIAQARRVAEMFDIPFYVIDAQAAFKARVVDFFVEGYVNGITPNPCLECNRHIRWDYLLRRALALDAQHLATGHYARVRLHPPAPFPQGSGPSPMYQLLKAVDEKKDQSYVLSVMTQAQLAHALFPIGQYTKPHVRALAREFKLPVAEREESQDLCFLADNDYRRFLTAHADRAILPGPIVRRNGAVIGEHTGLPFYTVGQRKGIGIAAREALYVVGMRPEINALVVGTSDELGHDRLIAAQVNWVSIPPPAYPIRAQVKIRYRAALAWATVTPLGRDRAEVTFDQRLRDIAPGQAAVFYDGDVCLGGGIIQRPDA